MNLTKNIPLIIASGLSILAFLETIISNITGTSDLFHMFGNNIIIGAIALAVVWLSKLINEKVWVYLFLFVLLISFSNRLDFSNFKISFSINELDINLIALVLTISHLGLNTETFKIKERTAQDINNEFENKVEYFLKKFSSKTYEELKTLENNDLIPEAKAAIDKLINKNQFKSK